MLTNLTPIHALEEDKLTNLFGRNYSSLQWGNIALESKLANTVSTGAGVVVAVVDTGVDGTHPDLEGRVIAGYNSITQESIPEGTNSDDAGHGTHVSGIIAGSGSLGIKGIAPNAKIMPVKVLNGDGGGSDESVANGIIWAEEHGADVINLSLGGTVNPFAKSGSKSCEAVNTAYDKGVVVVVASGNEGSWGNPKSEPASCRGAISVAAVNQDLNKSYFSSYDATVFISAPGSKIVSSVPTTNLLPYDVWDGTSMATPFVTGVVALIKSKYLNLTPAEVRNKLSKSALDIGEKGRDPETGYGIVNAALAVGLKSKTIKEIKKSISKTFFPVIKEGVWDGKQTKITWAPPTSIKPISYEVILNQGNWERIHNLPSDCLNSINEIRNLEENNPSGYNLATKDFDLVISILQKAKSICTNKDFLNIKYNEVINWLQDRGESYTKSKTINLSGSKNSISVPLDFSITGRAVVIAKYNGYQTISPIFTNIEDLAPSAKVEYYGKIVNFSASWGEKGIDINVTTNNYSGPVNIMLMDTQGSWFKTESISTSNFTEVIEPNSPVRNHVVAISFSIDGDSKQLYLDPEFFISLSMGSAGESYIYLKGDTSNLCITKKIGCSGTLITFIDKINKIELGSTYITDNLKYAVDLPSVNFLNKEVYAKVGETYLSNIVKAVK